LAAAGLNAVAYLFAARRLATDEFATAASVVAVVSVVVGFADLGTTALITRAATRAHPPAIADMVALRRVMTALLAVVGTVLCAIGAIAGLDALLGIGLGLVTYGASFLLEQSAVAVLQGGSRFELAGAILVLDKVVALAILPWLVSASGPASLVLAQSAGASAGAIAGFSFRQVRQAVWRRRRGDVVEAARQGWPIALGGAAVQALSLDVVIVGLAAGPSAGALIALPSRLAVPIGILASSVSSVTMVGVASRDSHSRRIEPIRVGIVTMVATGGLLLPAFIWADVLVDRFLPAAFAGSTTPVRLMLVSAALAAGSQPIGGALIGARRERQLARLLVLTAALGLITCWIGALLWSATGGSLGRVVATTAAMVMVSHAWRGVERAARRAGALGGT